MSFTADYAETLVYGETVPWLEEQKNLMAYLRRGERTLLVVGNFQGEGQSMSLPAPTRKVLLNNLDALSQSGELLHLAPWQLIVFEMDM